MKTSDPSDAPVRSNHPDNADDTEKVSSLVSWELLDWPVNSDRDGLLYFVSSGCPWRTFNAEDFFCPPPFCFWKPFDGSGLDDSLSRPDDALVSLRSSSQEYAIQGLDVHLAAPSLLKGHV